MTQYARVDGDESVIWYEMVDLAAVSSEIDTVLIRSDGLEARRRRGWARVGEKNSSPLRPVGASFQTG